MVFKKIFNTDAPIVIGDTQAGKMEFPPGFRYRIGGIIYTVRADVTQEANSPLRELSLSDGATEIISIESIAKDLKEEECEIMDPDQRFVIKETKEKKAVKKKAKKKTPKKKNYIKDKNKKKNVR